MLDHTPDRQPVLHKEKLRLAAEAENSQGHTLNDPIRSNPFQNCFLLSRKYALESNAFVGLLFYCGEGRNIFKSKNN